MRLTTLGEFLVEVTCHDGIWRNDLGVAVFFHFRGQPLQKLGRRHRVQLDAFGL
jgi:hypothetical protein